MENLSKAVFHVGLFLAGTSSMGGIVRSHKIGAATGAGPDAQTIPAYQQTPVVDKRICGWCARSGMACNATISDRRKGLTDAFETADSWWGATRRC